MRWMNRLPIRIWDCFVTTSCSFKMDRKHGKDTEFKWKTKPNSIQFQVVRYFFFVLLSSAFFFIPFECAIFYVLMDFFLFLKLAMNVYVFLCWRFFSVLLWNRVRFILFRWIVFHICFRLSFLFAPIFYYTKFLCTVLMRWKMQGQQRQFTKFRFQLA